ncbi:MAG: vitamin K epoxide reductase family protein [Anaerolineales bacterium]|nr:vitamin K epoxide reductase family protein [Anaerolineales bacterium]
MRNKKALMLLCLGGLILFSILPARMAWAAEPVVCAVIFYSPTCGHCHKVLTEDLPPLIEQYGDQLQIIAINVTLEQGQALFQAALQKFGLERGGVPTLVVGDHVLVGSVDIPEQFPGLIKQYLVQGGVDWPDIPGLAEAIGAAQVTPTPSAVPPTLTAAPSVEPAASVTAAPLPTIASASVPSNSSPGLVVIGDEPASLADRLAHDPAGNALAIVVLLGMIVTVGRSAIVFPRLISTPLSAWREWAIPVLALIGFGVAAYLAYVETAHVSAVCGPVGDCNTVQQSAYARLFGVLPIGVLGVLGHIAILAAWLVWRFGRGRLTDLAALALLGMTAFGTLFSIYLTFLEPFVIGATCAWCLSSAIIMTLLLWLALPSGRQAIINLYQGDSHA